MKPREAFSILVDAIAAGHTNQDAKRINEARTTLEQAITELEMMNRSCPTQAEIVNSVQGNLQAAQGQAHAGMIQGLAIIAAYSKYYPFTFDRESIERELRHLADRAVELQTLRQLAQHIVQAKKESRGLQSNVARQETLWQIYRVVESVQHKLRQVLGVDLEQDFP